MNLHSLVESRLESEWNGSWVKLFKSKPEGTGLQINMVALTDHKNTKL